MNNLKIIVLLVAMFALIISCKEEDGDPSKGNSGQEGIWTAQYNGQAWTGDTITKKVPTSGQGVIFNANGKDNSVIILGFSQLPAAGDSLVIPGTRSYFSYYPTNGSSTGMESGMEGYVLVKKYSADSLVARFEFKTSTRTFTKGVIKIKLN